MLKERKKRGAPQALGSWLRPPPASSIKFLWIPHLLVIKAVYTSFLVVFLCHPRPLCSHHPATHGSALGMVTMWLFDSPNVITKPNEVPASCGERGLGLWGWKGSRVLPGSFWQEPGEDHGRHSHSLGWKSETARPWWLGFPWEKLHRGSQVPAWAASQQKQELLQHLTLPHTHLPFAFPGLRSQPTVLGRTRYPKSSCMESLLLENKLQLCCMIQNIHKMVIWWHSMIDLIVKKLCW